MTDSNSNAATPLCFHDAAAHNPEGRLALSYRETAQSLGICERAVWQLVNDGELDAIRIGRSVRIPVSGLKQFISDRSQDADLNGGVA